MRIAVCVCLFATQAFATPAKPEVTGRKVLEDQFALVRGQDAKQRAFYDKDAVLLGSDSQERVAEIAEGTFDLIPTFGSFQVDRVKIDSFTGGGDQSVVWFTAGATDYTSGAAEGVGETQGSAKLRVSQVAVPDGTGWKVVASILDSGDRPSLTYSEPSALGGATATGPLAPLLASPKALSDALSSDPHTFVIGSDKRERAVGPAAAKKMLASWAKLSLSLQGKVREVATKTYAFAQAQVKWVKGKDTFWMEAMLVAVPSPDGTWKVVGVHYANIR